MNDGEKSSFKYHLTDTVKILPPFQKQKGGTKSVADPPFRFSEGGKIASKDDSRN